MKILKPATLGVSSLVAFLLACCGGHDQLSAGAPAGSAPSSEAKSSQPPPDSLAEAQGFLAAYGDGDPDRLRRWVESSYRPEWTESSWGGVDGAVAYWLAVYEQTGPLAFHSPGTHGGVQVLWFHGELTGAWLGIAFEREPEPPFRIRGLQVARGVQPTGAEPEPEVEMDRLPAHLEAHLQALCSRDLFSGAAWVARGTSVLFRGACGYADRERRIENRTDTRFSIASTAKMVTAVALAQLVEAGRLRFDDTLAAHVPEYPREIAEQVTLHHLLTHTSGIELDWVSGYRESSRRADGVEELLRQQLRFVDALRPRTFRPPGRFDYTNEGFDLLGVVIERASGLDYASYLQERIFGPSGMEHTTARLRESRDCAVGYTHRASATSDREWVVPRQPNHGMSRSPRPSGSLCSTVEDLFRFAAALREGRLLDPATVRNITEPKVEVGRLGAWTDHYGYGVEIRIGDDGERTFGHSGREAGVSSELTVDPAGGWIVVVLANYDRAATYLADHIRAVLPP